MKSQSKNYSKLYISLTEAIETFISEVKKHNLRDMATDEWTVKDIFRHLAYWHTYYAQNYSSLAKGSKPFVFKSKGGSTRNQDGVDSLKNKSQKELEAMLNKAQKSLYQSIVIKEVPKMNYIEHSEYKTKDFLEMITGHIQRHTLQVKRAKKVNK